MFLAHAGFEWIISGFIVFFGLMVFLAKLSRGYILDCILGAIVWFFVYRIHSGSTVGIMTATFAALLFDLVGLRILRGRRK